MVLKAFKEKRVQPEIKAKWDLAEHVEYKATKVI